MSPRNRKRGFTLPELMVSLLAGLLIVMAVMGLARTATTTFHEQIRTTASEMSLRIASQRLAGDLSRIGFFSTGNIRFDPTIARVNTAGDPAANTGSRYPGLANMAGVRIYTAGATSPAGNLSLSADNALKPQAIDITGNLTTNDQYLGVLGPASEAGCGAQSITLINDDPAVLRMLLAPDQSTPLADAPATTILQQAFIPVAGPAGQFAARIVDSSGKTHFVLICGAKVAGGRAILGLVAPALGSMPVLTPTDTSQKGGEDGPTPVQIAPIQTVRWNVQRLADAALDPPEDAAAKFDLVRQYISFDSGLPIGTPEVVAEYVVDLRFALTVDQSGLGAPAALSFDFEDEAHTNDWSQTNGVSLAPTSIQGPHRIRSIQYRVAGRAALADRTADMPREAAGYIYRYCISGPIAGCTRFARARTIVSEVPLLNQARFTY